MKTTILTIFCLLFLNVPDSMAQGEVSGIYFTKPLEADCALKKRLVNNNIKLCIVEEPVISAKEFLAISDIFYSDKVRSKAIVLVLNQTGKDQLYKVTSGFKGATLAVIVEDNIVSTITIDKEIIGGEILLYDKATSKTLSWIRKKVQKIIKDNQILLKK